uniref:Lethal giant larvae homologue 2 domain-containing protein n=1 Tax=Dendroctonus ponderosae TaxID=77166 RepID=A0AAR5PSI1_DENPD
MRKITFKGVFDNFRNSVAQPPSRADQEVQETLRPENFQVKRTFRHGFPYQPTAMAFDPIQKLLALGSKCGSLRIFGQPGVDVHVRHDMDGPPGSAAILHLQFLVNEGFLISATADDTLHLWSHKQKVPQIVQSLKFQKEKISYMHLPLQSKWMYVGTVKGNVHVVQIETFSLSGYIINWNKTIELTMKTHPGAIVHLSDNPLDASKLLIGYESGQIVLWDLRSRNIEMRWLAYDLRSISWHYEGKQFMCAHADGTLTTWNIRNSQKYVHISQPHAKFNKDGKPEQCKPIGKVEWKTNRAGEAFVIFSGGMPYDQACRTPSITVVHNKTTTVLEMEHNVIDFVTLCESPYISDMQEPFAIIALLQNDLVVVDLQTPGYPWIENPYPMNIHESPVTCVSYLADCPVDLIPAFYSVGRAGSSKRQGLSEMDWPINGGTWSAQGCSYAEVILTGHADGSIKFWDASAGTLQVLYKLKTSKIFEKPKSRSTESEEDPFAINLISLCPESRKLCVAGASSHVMLFTYKKTESSDEVMVLEIPIVYEVIEDEISPDCQFSGPGSAGSGNKLDLLDLENKREGCTLKVRTGAQKKPAGFQAQLVCLTPWNNGEPPSHITALTINSSYGLMAYGNEAGLVIVDIEQRVCLLNVGSPDLYGAQDPYYRVPRSPKKNQVVPEAIPLDFERQPRSPSIDQINGVCAASSTPPIQMGGSQPPIATSVTSCRPRPEPPRRSRSQDKLDSSFSRSRSSSMSSLENITSEAVQCLVFADSYTRKSGR